LTSNVGYWNVAFSVVFSGADAHITRPQGNTGNTRATGNMGNTGYTVPIGPESYRHPRRTPELNGQRQRSKKSLSQLS
jgi:hypothetical protein